MKLDTLFFDSDPRDVLHDFQSYYPQYEKKWGAFFLEITHSIAYHLEINKIHLIDTTFLRVPDPEKKFPDYKIPLRGLRHLQKKTPYYESYQYIIDHEDFSVRHYRQLLTEAFDNLANEHGVEYLQKLQSQDVYKLNNGELQDLVNICENIVEYATKSFRCTETNYLYLVHKVSENDGIFDDSKFIFLPLRRKRRRTVHGL